MPALNESHVEEAALSWFGELGYAVAHGPDLAPGELAAERDSFADVVLVRRLRDAITRLNPTIPDDAREEALRKVLRPDSPSFLANNRAFHHRLRDVFGPPARISVPSSPNLDLSSPNLAASSPNLTDERDADGCLLSDQLALPAGYSWRI